MDNTVKCLFCDSISYSKTVYENTLFNNKEFEYLMCNSCRLIYINPLPNSDDYNAMYPVSYQGNIVETNTNSYNELFNIIKKYKTCHSILDYGCGNGRFVIEALQNNYNVTGIEYNPELVAHLNNKLPKAKFYTIEQFYTTNNTYDIIFLSNVLEHLSNPKEIMLKLQKRINAGGLFVLEGPIEANFTLKLLFSKLTFFFRKKIFNNKAHHIPTHIFYSNKTNQEEFFKSIGLDTILYKITEDFWPFPNNIENNSSIKQKAMFYTAKASIYFSKRIKGWGDKFLYIGKITKG